MKKFMILSAAALLGVTGFQGRALDAQEPGRPVACVYDNLSNDAKDVLAKKFAAADMSSIAPAFAEAVKTCTSSGNWTQRQEAMGVIYAIGNLLHDSIAGEAKAAGVRMDVGRKVYDRLSDKDRFGLLNGELSPEGMAVLEEEATIALISGGKPSGEQYTIVGKLFGARLMSGSAEKGFLNADYTDPILERFLKA